MNNERERFIKRIKDMASRSYQESRYLFTDVTKLLTAKTVPVYIDREDEDIGFVDIDAVLPEIRIHP